MHNEWSRRKPGSQENRVRGSLRRFSPRRGVSANAGVTHTSVYGSEERRPLQTSQTCCLRDSLSPGSGQYIKGGKAPFSRLLGLPSPADCGKTAGDHWDLTWVMRALSTLR